MKTRFQKTGESLQKYASKIERLANLAFSDYPANVREIIHQQHFLDGLKDGEIYRAIRMVVVQDLKSALLCTLKLEATTQATGHLSSSYPRKNKEDRNIKYWGCGGTGHVRSNCPRVNQDDICRTSVIESKKVCIFRKRSVDRNVDFPSRKPCPENSKYCSRVEKKFGVSDPVIRQVSRQTTSELDPWNDESVRKDQLGDSEIKPIIAFKESVDEKQS
ncbi:gag-pol [Trichonephila clavipes]|nr:gag-pol [Trichonephila clavipes]